MTLPPIFTPEYYAHWRDFEAGHWWTAGMRDVASMLFSLAELPERGVLLDVGCGSGQGMHWFAAAHPAWRTIGIDLGHAGLLAAQQAGLPMLIHGTATDLPIPTDSVDAITTLDVLQHLPLDGGDERALAEMYRVLRPGGCLYVRTNAQAFPHVPDDPDAVWHKYEPAELAVKLRRAGFSIIRLSRVNALLGLAEIPGALRRDRQRHTSYEVVHRTVPRQHPLAGALKRAWLRSEGRAIRAGVKLPTGRSLVALCRASKAEGVL